MTTTQHRPGCTRPGWTLEQTEANPARVVIARCAACGAVELRNTTTTGGTP